MSQFFINRPIFAWVIALFIILGGVLAIPQLPVAQYPAVAPPSVSITATYPGATPETMNTSVISLLEREIAGVDNLLYFESSSDTSGMASITVTFKPGTNINLAQMDIQNQIKVIEPRLPQVVRQNGVNVEAANSGFLMMVGLTSPSEQYEEADLSDYFARHVSDELRRVPGVGKVQLFGAEKAIRVWLDPIKLFTYKLSVNDVLTALGQQNILVSPGRMGDEPALSGQRVTYPLTVQGQLSSLDEFRNITLKANNNGSRLRLADVARVESGLQSYAFAIRENGLPATAAAIQLSPGANAISAAEGMFVVVTDSIGNPTYRYPATARSDTVRGFTAAIPNIALNIWDGSDIQSPSRYLIATSEELDSALWTVNSLDPNSDGTVSLTLSEYSNLIYI